MRNKDASAGRNESMLLMCTCKECEESSVIEAQLSDHILDVHLKSEILSIFVLRPAPVQISLEELTPISLEESTPTSVCQMTDDASRSTDEATENSQTDPTSGYESDNVKHHAQPSSRQSLHFAP